MDHSLSHKRTEAFDRIYTAYSDIQSEVQRRSRDAALQAKVRSFFGESFLPELAQSSPRAVLSRSIATPNTELRYFLDLCGDFALDPLILEYPDKFVARNRDKYHLCKLFFHDGYGKRYGPRIQTKRIVDFNTCEGQCFAEINTLWGENIIDLHHHLLLAQFPTMQGKVADFTRWFDTTKNRDDYYYLSFLALFVCNAVLFENFLIGDKEEASFINDKFLPSFDKVTQLFGVKPLIYPLLPFENETHKHWLCYSKKVMSCLENHLMHPHGLQPSSES